MDLINSKILNSIRYLKELADKCRLLDDRFVQYCLYRLSVRWDSGIAERLYTYLVDNMESSLLTDCEFELPRWDDLDGEMVLGGVLGNGVPFRYDIGKLTKHILVTGTSGSGKTNLAKVLIDKVLCCDNVGIEVFDPKNEYADIAHKYSDFLLMNWSDLRFNPFMPPPNVPETQWYQTIVGHLSQCYNFWEGSESLLLKLIFKVREQKENPTVLDLIIALNHTSARFKQKDLMIMSTVANRLELLYNGCHEVVQTQYSILPDLRRKHFVLQTGGLMSEIESWLVEFLLIWDFMHRMYNEQSRPQALYIFDECQHRIFSSEKERKVKKISSSLISMLVDEAREMNMGLVALSQEPSMLIKSMLNNSWLKVTFHLGSGQELRIMSEAMGLTKEQADSLFHLEVGEGVLRMAGGGWMDPFPVKFDEFQPITSVDRRDFIEHQSEMKEKLYRDAGIEEDDPHRSKRSSSDDYGYDKKDDGKDETDDDFNEEFDVLS